MHLYILVYALLVVVWVGCGVFMFVLWCVWFYPQMYSCVLEHLFGKDAVSILETEKKEREKHCLLCIYPIDVTVAPHAVCRDDGRSDYCPTFRVLLQKYMIVSSVGVPCWGVYMCGCFYFPLAPHGAWGVVS